jgi:hypothetical protein
VSATREHRNAGHVEDAIALIGSAITCAETLVDVLAAQLPDANDHEGAIDVEGVARTGLAALRERHAELTDALGL